MVTQFRVHDLVRLDAPVVARGWPDAEAWVRESLSWAPWAVVRRERAALIPIGIRGHSRCERYAAFVSRDDVACAVAPGDLVERVTRATRLGATFIELREAARPLGVRIAPIGSFGFELASGSPATTAASDLDVLVRADRLDRAALVAFARTVDAAATAHGVRIDVELAYAQGAVALHELLARPPAVLFKTEAGPQLLPCPI